MSIFEAFFIAYGLGACGNFAFIILTSGELPAGAKGWALEAVISLFPTVLILAVLMLSGVVESRPPT